MAISKNHFSDAVYPQLFSNYNLCYLLIIIFWFLDLRSEFDRALNDLNNGKAPGVVEIL